jgi:hypothetical protein
MDVSVLLDTRWRDSVPPVLVISVSVKEDEGKDEAEDDNEALSGKRWSSKVSDWNVARFECMSVLKDPGGG